MFCGVSKRLTHLRSFYSACPSKIFLDILDCAIIFSVSFLNLAQPFGSVFSGFLSDALGRKITIISSSLPMMSGWLLIAMAIHVYMLYIGRLMTGLALGFVTTSIQVIIAETMEPIYRDFMIGVPFVSYNFGIAMVYQMGANFHWRTIAWLSMTIPLLSAGLLLFVPESPVWLVNNGREKHALETLTDLRNNAEMAKAEVDELVIRREIMLKENQKKLNLCRLICRENVLKAITVTYVFRVAVIWSGALLLVFYMYDMIHLLCTDVDCTPIGVYTAYVRFFFTTLCCLLLFYIGRRSFIISTSLFAGGFLTVLVLYRILRGPHQQDTADVYVTSLCLIGYCGTSASFMLMTGVMTGELMPARIRGRLGGYNSALFNLLTFAASKVLPTVLEQLGANGTLAVFSSGCFGVSLTVFFLMPETKNLTLGQIEDYFRDEKWLWMNRRRKKLSVRRTATA